MRRELRQKLHSIACTQLQRTSHSLTHLWRCVLAMLGDSNAISDCAKTLLNEEILSNEMVEAQQSVEALAVSNNALLRRLVAQWLTPDETGHRTLHQLWWSALRHVGEPEVWRPQNTRFSQQQRLYFAPIEGEPFSWRFVQSRFPKNRELPDYALHNELCRRPLLPESIHWRQLDAVHHHSLNILRGREHLLTEDAKEHLVARARRQMFRRDLYDEAPVSLELVRNLKMPEVDNLAAHFVQHCQRHEGRFSLSIPALLLSDDWRCL
jgi:hypothetical protein